jgi:hypothetical protein
MRVSLIINEIPRSEILKTILNAIGFFISAEGILTQSMIAIIIGAIFLMLSLIMPSSKSNNHEYSPSAPNLAIH